MDCKVNPGRSVQTDKLYLPGEMLELDSSEAKNLQKRGIVTIATEKTAPVDGSGKPARPNAPDSIKLAKVAETVEALDILAEGEDRSTVIDAIAKRREELSTSQ